jgi:hypothetical protein
MKREEGTVTQVPKGPMVFGHRGLHVTETEKRRRAREQVQAEVEFISDGMRFAVNAGEFVPGAVRERERERTPARDHGLHRLGSQCGDDAQAQLPL